MRRAIRFALSTALTMFLILFGAVGVAPSYASSSSSIQSSFFGITLNTSTTSWPVTVPFGTVGKTASGGPLGGMTDTYWLNLEPSNGTFDWTPLDNLLAAAKSVGITNFIYTLYETPTWASSNQTQSCFATASFGIYGCAAPPKYINDWDNFITALVTRYKGEIQYYELWNEPNISTEYSGNVTEMVTMAQHAYDIIKSIDPSAIVLTPGVAVGGIAPYTPGCPTSQCWLAEYLQDGGGQYADGVAFHGKTCLSNNSLCAQEGISCTSAQIEACAGTSLVNQISDIRALMATYGLSGKPLVNTEGGYSQDVGENNLWGSNDQQTAFVSRFFIIQASEGLQTAVWFSWFPSGSSVNGASLSGMGTTSASSEIIQAYTLTHSLLLGSTFNGPCNLSNGVWTCNLVTSAGNQDLIVFADTNSSASSYAPSNQYTQYLDLSGQAHTITSGSSIPINEKPVLLESSSLGTSTTSAPTTQSTTTTTTSVIASTSSSFKTAVTSTTTSTSSLQSSTIAGSSASSTSTSFSSLVLSPTSGPSGTTLTIAGLGLEPNTTFNYCFESGVTDPASATACPSTLHFTTDASGNTPSSLTLTASGQSGLVVVSNAKTGAIVAYSHFNVTSLPKPASSFLFPLLIVAAILVIFVCVAVVVIRKRRWS